MSFIIENGVLTGYKPESLETDVVIPEGVTSIGEEAFFGCESLASINIPEGVTSIGKEAFWECEKLKNVTLPESLISIGYRAFSDCESLESINIPEGVTSIGEDAFCDTPWLKKYKGDMIIISHILYKYNGNAETVVIPDSIKYIAEGAFCECKSLKSINIPESITSIGEDAFSWCENLKNVTLPENLISIGDGAFRYCKNLKSINIPEGVTSIGVGVFIWCESLESINIPEGVTNIGKGAFSGCRSLKSINIPEGVTSIEEDAFNDCRSLKSINIPEGVTSIGEDAFSWCESLASINIPEGVTSIEKGAFSWCKNLKSINIPEGVTSIEKGAFSCCKSFTNINIPEGVTSIEEEAFRYCKNLKNVTLPESLISIGNSAFEGCKCLTNINIPESVTIIGEMALADVKNFQIPNPNSKLKIKKLAFGNPEKIDNEKFAEIKKLTPYMTDVLLKDYILSKWQKLEPDFIADVFLNRHSTAVNKIYVGFNDKTALDRLGTAIVSKLTGKLSAKICNSAVDFIVMYYNIVDAEILKSIYQAVESQKNSKDSLTVIKKNPLIMNKLGLISNKTKNADSPETVILLKATQQEIARKLYELYSVNMSELPVLKDKNGKQLGQFVLAWLLYADLKKDDYYYGFKYDKPGCSDEVKKIIDMIDQSSLQKALMRISDKYLGGTGGSKKHNLAYPVCRYADETTLDALMKEAPSWRSGVSGKNAPALREFRSACVYSELRGAVFFAEKYDDLGHYANIRGTDADTIRDTVLSDVGLDEYGRKSYNLGNQTVTAVLQNDLTYLIELPTGKTAKSIPKKDADAVLYEKAKKDFDGMKKTTKKVVSNRNSILLEEFLDGTSKKSKNWQEAYFSNPILRQVAKLIVWEQDNKTFTMTDNGLIDSNGNQYKLNKTSVAVAHPMEMQEDDVKKWQDYFMTNGLKQPFLQIWEPVCNFDKIKPERYADSMIPYYRFINQKKHGISVEDSDFHNYIYITLDDINSEIDRIDFARHSISMQDRFCIKSIVIKYRSRRANHIIAYLDRITIWERVRNDDVEVVKNMLDGFTAAQIMEFIEAAQEANAVNMLAFLMDYKNENFADVDPMAKFTLDW